MNKKIFQIVFFAMVLLTFGVVIKNYVNSIESDINDYTCVLDEEPQSKISRLSPIIIRLAQDIDDKKFPVDKPLQDDILQFTPPIDGYIYFTDKKTIEFQPNNPLPAGAAYSCKLNVKKLFPAAKLKPFHFKISTPATTFTVKINEVVYYDTNKTGTPYIKGHITFNDYVAFDKKRGLIDAHQNNRKLSVVYLPDNAVHSINFLINGIKRTKHNKNVVIKWSGKPINSEIDDSTSIDIASANSFKVVYCKLQHFPKPVLKIRFTDAIDNKITPASFINITQLNDYSIAINQNEVTILFNSITNNTHKLQISKTLSNNKGITLNNDFNFNFDLTHPYPIIYFYDSSHYISKNRSPNIIDVNVLNLKRITVKVTHVPDKNMIQFLQVNDITGKNELERVGKSIFIKTFNLQDLLNYNPNELTVYSLNLLGADLSKNGLYNFEFTYDTNNVVYNFGNTVIAKDSAQIDKKTGTNIAYSHNIIFSELHAIAKRTTLDTLYVMVSNQNTGLPVKNAKVEIFDYQQNRLATLITDNNGVAKAKIKNHNVFVRVQHKSQITYLKLSCKNSIAKNSESANGVKPNRGLLCHIEGLKPAYLPTDSLHVGVVIKKSGSPDFKSGNLEIMLESPNHFFFDTRITSALSSSLTLYKTALPNNCKSGNWKIVINYGQTKFKYPFIVLKKNSLILPVNIIVNPKKNTISITADTKKHINKNTKTVAQITPITNPQFQSISDSLIKANALNGKTYKIHFNKYGKAEIELPKWTKTGIQFHLSVKEHLPNSIVLQKDTVLRLNAGINNTNIKTTLQTYAGTEVKSCIKTVSYNSNTPTITVNTDKQHYNIGDSCNVFFKSALPVFALATIENSTHIINTQWVQSAPSTQKISFIITKQMLPCFYISFLPYHSFENTPTLKYIPVSNNKNKNQALIEVDIPHDWKPESKIPLHIANINSSSLTYFIYISPKNSMPDNKKPIADYFNQKQQSCISTWSSDYLQSNKTDTGIVINSDSKNTVVKSANFKAGTTHKPQLLLGPFSISGNKRVTHYIGVPETQSVINVKIVGIAPQTGKVFEMNKTAAIYEPFTIKAKLPKFINAGDIVELPVKILNNTIEPDTLLIQIKDMQNIELYSPVDKNVVVNKNSLTHFTIKFSANKMVGNGHFKILVKSGKAHTTKTITLPIKGNPSYLTHSTSAILPMQKPWQQTITPIGIKETNTAALEFSNFNIPNIWFILQSLNKNSSNNLAYLINKSFPLIYLNKIINNDELKHRFSETIDNTLLQLLKYQTKQGGFKNRLTDTEPAMKITSYAGEFMLEAEQNGYNINEGVLNRWKRYQQRELQKLKFLSANENSNQAYVVYTLTLSGLVGQKQLHECMLHQPNKTINKLYIAKAFAASGNFKDAIPLIQDDSIEMPIEKMGIAESALMLSLANDMDLEGLSHTLIVQLNKQIKNKNTNPHEIVLALNSLLKTMISSGINSNSQLIYQINNGKELTQKSNNLLSYIAIPLEFTLPKHIDIKNTGTDTLYINLVYSGNPQKIPNYSKRNKLLIANRYYYLDNSEVKIPAFNTREYYKQVITYKNLNKQLKQNLSVSIPTPCGVELIYSNIPLLNNEYSTNDKGTIQTQILLEPYETTRIILVFKTKFKGQYISYPIKTFNNNLFYSETYTTQQDITIK